MKKLVLMVEGGSSFLECILGVEFANVVQQRVYVFKNGGTLVE